MKAENKLILIWNFTLALSLFVSFPSGPRVAFHSSMPCICVRAFVSVCISVGVCAFYFGNKEKRKCRLIENYRYMVVTQLFRVITDLAAASKVGVWAVCGERWRGEVGVCLLAAAKEFNGVAQMC